MRALCTRLLTMTMTLKFNLKLKEMQEIIFATTDSLWLIFYLIFLLWRCTPCCADFLDFFYFIIQFLRIILLIFIFLILQIIFQMLTIFSSSLRSAKSDWKKMVSQCQATKITVNCIKLITTTALQLLLLFWLFTCSFGCLFIPVVVV